MDEYGETEVEVWDKFEKWEDKQDKINNNDKTTKESNSNI